MAKFLLEIKMKEKINKYKNRLINKANVLIEEIQREKEEFKKKYPETHVNPEGYVLKENLATYCAEIEAIKSFKQMIENMDPESFSSVEEFKNRVLEELNKMYSNYTRLRAGLRIMIECIKSTFV